MNIYTLGLNIFHADSSSCLMKNGKLVCAFEEERLAEERAKTRRSLVSTGDRSAKIRTYNFPQNRMTDHRINYTSYDLENLMNGELTPLIEQLQLAEQQEQLTGMKL